MDANEQLTRYNCTDQYHKCNFGLLITDGALALAETFSCFWFLDIIASYQKQLRDQEFQVWSLGKNEDSSAIVLCTDGNNKLLVSQEIPLTDFKATVATVWVEICDELIVALLPSEH